MSDNKAGGIILVNKPRGMTSFGVVSRLRKLTGIRRIGHCGTLDPFAEGLLPVCIGRATSAVRYMDSYDKSYRCEIRFGRSTDTMDTEGSTLEEYVFSQDELNRLKADDYAGIRKIVSDLPGDILQTPPMYSAVKVNGRPLYSYARKGQTIDRKARKVRIYSAEVENIECIPEQLYLSATLNIRCSKGTYIRVIADSIGREAGIPAHAQKLFRISCGPYFLDQAQDIEQMFEWSGKLPDQKSFVDYITKNKILLPIESAFAGFPTIEVSENDGLKLIYGQPVKFDEKYSGTNYDISHAGRPLTVFVKNKLIAVGALSVDEDNIIWLKTERVFIDLEDFRSICT
jgi:tRNA pseudouridine55 synthase